MSGGLDSSIVLKVILDQGIEAMGLKFNSPFFADEKSEKSLAQITCEQFGVNFISLTKDEGFLDIVKKPKFGHGSGLNPCIDCKIYMLKRTKLLMEQFNASFVVTGEVLGQRPMSQHKQALNLIEKESGMSGKILRALSAKYLPKTDMEKECIIDISKLPEINGRGRHKQLELAKIYGIKSYSTPAGGCLLTDKNFSIKLKDLIDNKKDFSLSDVPLLKIGRHFRFGGSKIVSARNEDEVKKILSLKNRDDLVFEIKNGKGTTTILQGEINASSILLSQKITAYYSKSTSDLYEISMRDDKTLSYVSIDKPKEDEISQYNLAYKKLR